jgi:hypothetical protein
MGRLYFSKYSNLKLGKDSDKPEYNGVSWDRFYKTPFRPKNCNIFKNNIH